MKGAYRLLIIASAVLGPAACAAPPPDFDRVPVAPGVTLSLPSPAELGRSVEAVQLVTARHGGDVFLFEGRLSVSPQMLTMVGTDPLGRRAMSLRWSPAGLEVERASWLPDGLRPENVLADIVLLYWPDGALARHLAGATVEAAADGRHIRRDGADMIVLSYRGDPWSGVARLDNLAWGYQLEVRSSEVGR
jgi:Protein of unknown function (DUF3261).